MLLSLPLHMPCVLRPLRCFFLVVLRQDCYIRSHGVMEKGEYSIFTAISFRHDAAPREIVVATTPYALW
jgi:hypothetical protein